MVTIEGGGVDQMEGEVFKSHLLNSLCSCRCVMCGACVCVCLCVCVCVCVHVCVCGICVCRWAPNSVLHVANMCRDISMTLEEMQFLIEKILR